MPITQLLSVEEQQKSSPVERPLTHGFAPYALMGEYLMMIPLVPDHQHKLYADIFGQPQVMKYFGAGKSFTFDEYAPMHLERAMQNLTPQYDQYTGRLSRFTWTIITQDGIAGRLHISPAEGRTELAYCISPLQQGRVLARRSSELVIAYMGEETAFIATTHPQNKASSKTLEKVHYPDGKFVFFRDSIRQNVPNTYGVDQPRDYFLSQRPCGFTFFSFRLGPVHIDTPKELQYKTRLCSDN